MLIIGLLLVLGSWILVLGSFLPLGERIDQLPLSHYSTPAMAKTIKKIIEQTGVETIDIEDDGRVLIASLNKESAQKALEYVNGLVEVPEVGKIYDAEVVKVANFGAFCEFLPGKQGLVHVSELADKYVKDVASVVKVGDRFKVKLVEIDQMKRMNLSKKQAEAEAEANK